MSFLYLEYALNKCGFVANTKIVIVFHVLFMNNENECSYRVTMHVISLKLHHYIVNKYKCRE